MSSTNSAKTEDNYSSAFIGDMTEMYYRNAIPRYSSNYPDNGLTAMKCSNCGSSYAMKSTKTKQTMFGSAVCSVYKCTRCNAEWSF